MADKAAPLTYLKERLLSASPSAFRLFEAFLRLVLGSSRRSFLIESKEEDDCGGGGESVEGVLPKMDDEEENQSIPIVCSADSSKKSGKRYLVRGNGGGVGGVGGVGGNEDIGGDEGLVHFTDDKLSSSSFSPSSSSFE